MISIIIGLLIFTVIVVVHEFGHFIVARKCGIFVEEFAIGMGPKLFTFKPGETLYSIRLIPLGGFCKMLGEDTDSKEERAFNSKKVSSRCAVILAGAAMNFVLAFFTIIFISSFSSILTLKISKVSENSPAQKAGIEIGDQIIKVNGKKIGLFEDLPLALSESVGRELSFSIKKSSGEIVQKQITPMKSGDYYILGIQGSEKLGFFAKSVAGLERAGFGETINNAYHTMFFYVKIVTQGVTKLLTLNVKKEEMSGPIGIVSMIGTTYDETIGYGVFATVITMLRFMALLSVNIGMFNLLPFPALDGGRFIFLIIEGVRGKPIPPEREGMVHLVGFALLMILAVFIAYNDIVNIL